jgi:transcriptional regulator with XRE-family HTH domain
LTAARRHDNNAPRVADEPERETIGKRVRRLRLERGLSQRDLEAPGASYAYISRIEAGARAPSLRAIHTLARKLGVDPEYLETGRRVPQHAERELRLSDAELELRMSRDLDRAEAVFRAEVVTGNDPKMERDAVLEARAHAGIGLLAATRGETDEAISHLDAAVGSGYFPPETRPDLYRALGHAYLSSGAGIRAVALFERCLAELRERKREDATLEVRFAVYLASAHSARGDTELARLALDEASMLADEAATPQVRINLLWAMAREAWMEADSEAALDLMRRAIGLLESSEDSYNLALAHLLCAQMMNMDGRGDEADRHLERAERLLVLRGESSDLGVLRAEQAKRAVAQERAEDALALATEAVRLIGDDARYLGGALQALAAAHAASGASDEAERIYREALKVLSERRKWREAATVARDCARLVRGLGREDDAYKLLEQATYLMARQTRVEALRTLGEREESQTTGA